MKNKITFKNMRKLTGLQSIGSPEQSVAMKLDKKKFGMICPPNWETREKKWSILLSIKKPEPDKNCDWKNLLLENRFNSADDAKSWIISNIDNLLNSYKFHFYDDGCFD